MIPLPFRICGCGSDTFELVTAEGYTPRVTVTPGRTGITAYWRCSQCTRIVHCGGVIDDPRSVLPAQKVEGS